MRLALAVPEKKTVLAQVWPAAIAVVLVAGMSAIVPVRYPVEVTAGSITPGVVRPGDLAEVEWTQTWRDLCPVAVTREFSGIDDIRKSTIDFVVQPPVSKGQSPYVRPLIIPELPVGPATYHSVLKPQCLFDRFVWQRTYKTPQIQITVLPKLPAGPH